MKLYPYIGKMNDDNGIVLFTKDSHGCQLNADAAGWYYEDIGNYDETEWSEVDFTNITKAYLKNKRVKIESPEHSEFVQKLAFRAGYSWGFGGQVVTLTDRPFLIFNDDGYIRHSSKSNKKAIQLPMPPEELSTSEDVVEENWQPVIGEKALAPSDGNGSLTTVTVAYFGDDDYVLVFDSKKKPMWVCKSLLKPLSKEDIILEEVITFLEDANCLGTKVTAMGLVEKFNIDLKENNS